MNSKDTAFRIINSAIKMGADLAGTASVFALKKLPSHKLIRQIGLYQGAVEPNTKGNDFEINLPDRAQSALVIALSHPENEPELDWWQGKGTPGNSKLIAITKKLSKWIETQLNIDTFPMPYHIQAGGIFLKDVAVLAGLGVIGKNNMLITPSLGPRIRLRAMLLSAKLPSMGPMVFTPCKNCGAPCKQACPQSAFKDIIYNDDCDVEPLPGLNGCYSRDLCGARIEANRLDAKAPIQVKNKKWFNSREKIDTKSTPVKYCRRCEFACSVGKKKRND